MRRFLIVVHRPVGIQPLGSDLGRNRVCLEIEARFPNPRTPHEALSDDVNQMDRRHMRELYISIAAWYAAFESQSQCNGRGNRADERRFPAGRLLDDYRVYWRS